MNTFSRLHEALAYAETLHRKQVRKGSGIPYIAHLLAVASLVIEMGGDEEEAMAALLHDGPEDQGGLATLEEIGRRFGPRVREIVRQCSDSLEAKGVKKAPWKERKTAYLQHLGSSEDTGCLRVSLADKLHNLRSILADHDQAGAEVFDRFRASPPEIAWYYESLAQRLHEGLPCSQSEELLAAAARLKEIVAAM